MKKKCEECGTYTIDIAPENLRVLKRQKGEYGARRKPAGTSIEKTVNEIIREWVIFTKTEPIINIDNNGNYIVLREVNEIERLHLINAINKNTVR